MKKMTLEQFKRSNKVRRVTLAKKAGMSMDEYIKSLTTSSLDESKQSFIKELDRVVDTKKVIHNVVLLDSSGSMRGSKYRNALLGIEEELKTVSSTTDTTIYHYLYDFLDSDNSLNEKYAKVEGFALSEIRLNATGFGTPLYKSITELLLTLSIIPKHERVLVKIYTDGDNNREHEYLIRCRDLINKCNNENFTITFVATEDDMDNIVRRLQLDSSNTLTVSNTGDGFKEAFSKSLVATQDYVTKVENNEEVSSGFYKSIGKL